MDYLGCSQVKGNERFVSDGHGSASFSELQASLAAWDAWLKHSGIARGECVALPTGTNRPSAAALLALLTLEQSVLVRRKPIRVAGDRLAPDGLPPFCRVALVASDDQGGIGPERYRVVRCKDEGGARLRSDVPFAYLPTSGTTGKPKIASYEPTALLENARNVVGRLQLNPRDRVLIPVPLAHMYGLGAALLPALLAGASVGLVADANLLTYVQAEAEFDPTVAYLTPSFCHLLVKGRKRDRAYRLTILAGDRADEQTFTAYEQRHGCTVNLYGSTEQGVICAGGPDESFSERRDSAGLPLPGVKLARPDCTGDGSEPFPLRVDHPYGCAGYADETGTPARPQDLFRDGWFYTRDLARLDEAGRIQLAGRFDHTVKRDGFLVAFADVERALLGIDAIERVVIVPGDMTPRGRELVAVCVGRPVEAVELRRSALTFLPAHAVPDRFVYVEELQLTATAKPDRNAIAAMISPAKEGSSDAGST